MFLKYCLNFPTGRTRLDVIVEKDDQLFVQIAELLDIPAIVPFCVKDTLGKNRRVVRKP